jgi:hypothetical protein
MTIPWSNQQLKSNRERSIQKRQQKILAMVIKKEEATRKQGNAYFFYLENVCTRVAQMEIYTYVGIAFMCTQA